MRSVTVQEAKTQLSALLRAVEAGEQVEIRRGRTPVALLVQRPPGRTLGDLEGVWQQVPEVLDEIWAPDEQDAVDFGLADGA